jgi:hypothetical protein
MAQSWRYDNRIGGFQPPVIPRSQQWRLEATTTITLKRNSPGTVASAKTANQEILEADVDPLIRL